jgi:hypothetical protein
MPDIPAEAVMASRVAADAATLQRHTGGGYPTADYFVIDAALAAALPHLHERWLAEVEGALRDDEAYTVWLTPERMHAAGSDGLLAHIADYLRDVLGAGAGGEG